MQVENLSTSSFSALTTVTLHSYFLLSLNSAVTVALPSFFASTLPPLSIVAILTSLLVHLRSVFSSSFDIAITFDSPTESVRGSFESIL